jgi:hypothetical protein
MWGTLEESESEGKLPVPCDFAHKMTISDADDRDEPVDVVYTATLSCSPAQAPRSIPDHPNPLDNQCLTELGLPLEFPDDDDGLWTRDRTKYLVRSTEETWVSIPQSCVLDEARLSALNDPTAFGQLDRSLFPLGEWDAREDAANGDLSYLASCIIGIEQQRLAFTSPSLGRKLPSEWVKAYSREQQSDYEFDFPVGLHADSTTKDIIPGMATITISRKFKVKEAKGGDSKATE